ncbi:MAG TPA: hypothetical protein GXX70_00770 [Tepidimicrobium sp.]|nr:hypothetical protein [Tepidimicrobium sp.]
MIITKIEPQKNKDRVNIYIDDKFAFGITKEIQYKYNLAENMEIDEKYIEKVLIEEEQSKCNNFALRFLGYRQRSEKEIVDRLQKKGFKPYIIDNTLDYLKDYGLINDLEFARSFMRDKIHINKHGPKRIRYDLYKKGISQAIIDKVLDEDDGEYDRALKLAQKKLPSYREDNRAARYRKLGGFLQRRGYSADCIYRVLNKLIK